MSKEELNDVLNVAGLEIDLSSKISTPTVIRVKLEDGFKIDQTQPIIPQVIDGLERLRDFVESNLQQFRAAVADGKVRE